MNNYFFLKESKIQLYEKYISPYNISPITCSFNLSLSIFFSNFMGSTNYLKQKKKNFNFTNLTFWCHISCYANHVCQTSWWSFQVLHPLMSNISFWTNQMVKFIINIFSNIYLFLLVTKLYDHSYMVKDSNLKIGLSYMEPNCCFSYM